MKINERFYSKGRHLTMYYLSLNMADETSITAPGVDTSKKVPIAAEVIPGESTGRLRVFDTGVDAFPDTSGLGFRAVTVPNSYALPTSLTNLLGRETGIFPQNLKAKRSITLMADSANAVPVFVGDSNTHANATMADAIGFPIQPGAAITLEITNPAEIYLDCVTSDCTIFWIAV